MKAILRLLLTLGLLGTAGTLLAESVAMVTDLSGAVTFADGGANRTLDILDDLVPGMAVQVQEGASVVLVYFASGTEYRIAGPARFKVGDTELEGETGDARTLVLVTDQKLSDVGKVAMAAVIMRGTGQGVKLLEPRHTILGGEPDFRWEAFEDAGDYHFTLTDEDGEVLADQWVEGTEKRFPAGVVLDAGSTYFWKVESRLSNGKAVSGEADFRLLTAEEKSLVEALRPVGTAPVSELVLYAVLLEQKGLLQQAREQWAVVADRRPGAKAVEKRARGCQGAVCF